MRTEGESQQLKRETERGEIMLSDDLVSVLTPKYFDFRGGMRAMRPVVSLSACIVLR